MIYKDPYFHILDTYCKMRLKCGIHEVKEAVNWVIHESVDKMLIRNDINKLVTKVTKVPTSEKMCLMQLQSECICTLKAMN